MIGNLSMSYNRARQGQITSELLEVIGGAEALNGSTDTCKMKMQSAKCKIKKATTMTKMSTAATSA